MIRFTVYPEKIIAKQRARVCSNGHAFTPERTVQAEKEIYFAFLNGLRDYRDEAVENMEGWQPLYLWVSFQFKHPKKSRIYPTCRPDLDNCIKTVCDALNPKDYPITPYKDDSQIVTIHATKTYGAENEIDIEIRRIEL